MFKTPQIVRRLMQKQEEEGLRCRQREKRDYKEVERNTRRVGGDRESKSTSLLSRSKQDVEI